jgi:hypothetical protein
MDDETERWVQCALCTKWRCVPDTLLVDPNTRWICRYNVFSATYNRCDAPQETMQEETPPDSDAAAADDDVAADDDDAAGTAVPMAQEGLFHESQCACETCQQMNSATATWAATAADAAAAVGTPPLVSVLLNAIGETEHLAVQIEDEKVFLYGSDQTTANP